MRGEGGRPKWSLEHKLKKSISVLFKSRLKGNWERWLPFDVFREGVKGKQVDRSKVPLKNKQHRHQPNAVRDPAFPRLMKSMPKYQIRLPGGRMRYTRGYIVIRRRSRQYNYRSPSCSHTGAGDGHQIIRHSALVGLRSPFQSCLMNSAWEASTRLIWYLGSRGLIVPHKPLCLPFSPLHPHSLKP